MKLSTAAQIATGCVALTATPSMTTAFVLPQQQRSATTTETTKTTATARHHYVLMDPWTVTDIDIESKWPSSKTAPTDHFVMNDFNSFGSSIPPPIPPITTTVFGPPTFAAASPLYSKMRATPPITSPYFSGGVLYPDLMAMLPEFTDSLYSFNFQQRRADANPVALLAPSEISAPSSSSTSSSGVTGSAHSGMPSVDWSQEDQARTKSNVEAAIAAASAEVIKSSNNKGTTSSSKVDSKTWLKRLLEEQEIVIFNSASSAQHYYQDQLGLDALASEGNWTAYFDQDSTGLVYYFNAWTGESSWHPPTETFPTVHWTTPMKNVAFQRQQEFLEKIQEPKQTIKVVQKEQQRQVQEKESPSLDSSDTRETSQPELSKVWKWTTVLTALLQPLIRRERTYYRSTLTMWEEMNQSVNDHPAVILAKIHAPLATKWQTPLAKEGPWAAFWDKDGTGYVYYFNEKDRISQWDAPTRTFPNVDLKPGMKALTLSQALQPLATQGDWTAYFDAEGTALVYYYNEKSGESQWNKPTETFPPVYLTESMKERVRTKRGMMTQQEKKRRMQQQKQNAGSSEQGVGAIFSNLFRNFSNAIATNLYSSYHRPTSAEKSSQSAINQNVFSWIASLWDSFFSITKEKQPEHDWVAAIKSILPQVQHDVAARNGVESRDTRGNNNKPRVMLWASSLAFWQGAMTDTSDVINQAHNPSRDPTVEEMRRHLERLPANSGTISLGTRVGGVRVNDLVTPDKEHPPRSPRNNNKNRNKFRKH